MRVWIGGVAAAGLLLLAGLAQAQDTVRSYRFKTPLGDEVRCTIYREGGRERREVLQTFYNGSFVLDRDAAQANWAASGCMQHVANQSRPVSAEEQQRRFDELRHGPRYEGPGGLREQMVDLLCSDSRNVGSEECQHRSRPQTLLGHANLTFKYYVDFIPLDSRLLPHGYDDIVTVSHALDDADGPITKLGLVDALAAEAGAKAEYAPGGHQLRRVESAVEYLLRRGKIRCIHARHHSGYVWNHIPLTDDEWKAKAAALPLRTHAPLPVVRMSPPDAYVVSIGRGVEAD